MTPKPVNSPRPNLDSVATIRADGSRNFLHPADVKGRYTFARKVAAFVLIAVYVLLPWIQINGYPAVFIDAATLRFHFFGFTLAPQDLWLGFFLITGVGFLLFYVTAILGRVWCGWACPQTVFLEHVFRRVERLLEGPGYRRAQLDAAPWTISKILRRGGKHAIFVVLSLLLVHVFLAYFVSLPVVWEYMRHSPGEHWGVFLFVVTFAGVIYFNFAWFREQLCIILCPYGRLQSALIDDDSLVIGYDQNRGEPRGKVGTAGAGDCVDCIRCIQVCPTGIDIRQGLQMECIGCAACIDACDTVMGKIGRPSGLIRYDSMRGFAGLRTRFWRPRILAYSLLLAAGIAVMTVSLAGLRPATLGVSRMPGSPYYLDEAGVRNQFFVRLINKSHVPALYEVSVQSALPVGWRGLGGRVEVPAVGEVVIPWVITVPREEFTGPAPVVLTVAAADGSFRLARSVEFLGPDPQKLMLEEP